MNNMIKYKYLFAALVLAATAPVFAQNLPDGVYEEKNGIAYKKTATLKEGTTDTYTIDLEAFVTGEVTVKNISKPADIVLVLDVSGSMDENMYSYSYTARSSQGYSWNNFPYNTTLYYKHTDDNYYQVELDYWYYQGNRWSNYLFFEVNGTEYYLSGTTVTTTRPTQYTNDNATIWTGVLYTRSQTPAGTKMDNLKTAVKKFIQEIKTNDLYEKDDDGNLVRRKDKDGNETTLGNQIAIVKFARNRYYNSSASYNSDNAPITVGNHFDNNNYNYTEVIADFTKTGIDQNITSLNNAVDGMRAGGATAADYGMNLARLLLKSLPTSGENDRSESAKTVVFFTDGSPTYSNSFESNVASNAIGNAYTIKNTYDANVFSVGVFSSEDSNIRTFMNRVSSNYLTAQTMTNSANQTDTKYYQNASSADLSEIFETIAQASGGSGAEDVTAESTVTVDVVASSFSLPKDVTADDITVTVAPCTGKKSITWTNEDGESITKEYLTFGEEKEATEYGLAAITPAVDKATNTVTTQGFNFSDNWCGYDQEHNKYHGYKQIISFEIKVNPEAVGGPNVATNDSKSGIYVNGQQVAKFNRPTVKIPVSIWIKKQGLLGDDSAVFTIRYAPYQKGVDPRNIPKDSWKSFTKVMISKDTPKDPIDNMPVVKLVGLDPDFVYKIDEDQWAWSYSYQDNGTQYTVGEDLQNPFLFVNEPKETVKESEATVRNVFDKKPAQTTTD